MKKILILAITILLILPVFAVFLPQVAANSTGSKLSIPKVRNEKSISDSICREVQPRTESEEKFPKELKPLQQETPINQQEQTNESQFETKDPGAKTTTGLPDQSYVTSKLFENTYAVPSGNYEPMGSTSVVFTETFEGAFPGDNWWVGDANSGSGSDYWDDTSYRAASGSWSGWCAQVGDNSVYGGTNAQQHKYDNYMDAYMSKKYTVDMSAWDLGYVDFYAWYDTESGYDYLIAGWYDGSSFHYDNNYMLTGTATSWSRYYWRIPDSYLISSGAFSFSFHSDSSIVKEGVYLDNINLIRADVTLDNYYISPTSVHPGESFTAYYYVNNPCPFSISVGLGLSIRSPGGTVYSDPAHDTVVTVSPGSYWFSRLFTVPSSAPTGLYSVFWGIWSGTPGSSRNWGGTGWVSGQLTVAGWPDLMWTDIWTDPNPPTGGQNARIYSQIKNQGTGSTSTSFTNYFYIDGSYDSYGVNNGLAAGSVYNWYMDRTLGPGYHTIHARADVSNNVQESNEANNDYSESIWWKGPDLIVVDIWWIDAYGNRNPVITSGQPFTVYFQIKNNGDADAIGTFTSYVFVDGWGSAAGSNNGLAAGATFTWYTQNVYVSSTGSHPVRAVVDYNGVIAEANKDTGNGIGTGETNNERTVNLSVSKATWTVLAYMDADNNLEPYQINDFLSMAQVGSTSSVSILLEMDRGTSQPDDTRYNNWVDCRRFFITRGLEPYATNAISSLGEVNMGASATLSDFATWGIGRCQADKYLLVIEDHGGTWVGCCWDDTSGGDRLDSSEIKSALSTISSTLGRKIDLVWFNDCLMGSIEIAAQAYPYCNYMAASETIGWTDTWAYNTLLNSLVTNPSVSPQQYCVTITDLANPHDSPTHVTQSVCSIDLSKTSNLVTASNSLSQSLKNNLYQYRSQIQSARTSSSWMEGPYIDQDQRIIDLYQFAQNIKSMVPDSTIQGQAQQILDQIGPAGGSAGYIVMRERHSASASFCHGLSIYFPLNRTRYNSPSGYTTNVDFTSNTQWDEFLTCYYDVTPPNNPNSYTSSHTVGVWSSDNTIEVTWSGASDDLSGVYGYSRIWDTSPSTIPDTTVDQTGTFCISFPVSTGNSWYLHVRTVDNAGNWNPGAYNIGPFYVDTSPPNTPSISESHCGSDWTSHNSPYFTWSDPGDSGSGIDYYEGSIDGGAQFTVSSPYHPTWSDGIHNFKVRAVDKVGLRGSWSNIITVKIDTTPPPLPSPDDGVSGWSKVNTPTFSWPPVSDSGSGVKGYWWKVDGGFETWTTSTSVTLSPQSDGSHTFYVRAEDNAGNKGNYGTHVFQIDTTLPSNPTSYSSNPAINVWSSDNTVDISWSGDSDSPSGIHGFSFLWDQSPATAPDNTEDTTGTSITSPVLADGSNWYFHVRAVDNAGNWASGAYHVGPFEIDTAPPSTPSPDDGVSGPSSDNTPTFTWNPSIDTFSGVKGYWWKVDSGSETWTTLTSVTLPPQSDGSHTFYVRAEDNAGNKGDYGQHSFQIVTSIQKSYLVVRGLDDRIYYRTYDFAGDTWSSWTVLPGSTPDSPAAVVCNNELHIVVRGMDGRSLWHGYVNLADNTFNSWARLSGWTPSAPTLASNGTVLCLVVRGGDNHIYYRTYSFSPRGWGSWNVLSTGSTCDGPAAAMLGNDLHIVVRGFSATNVYGNYSLWHIIVKPNVGVMRGWVSVSGYTPSKPVLSANHLENKLFLAVRGLDNRIYWRTYDAVADSWGTWNVVPTGSTCDGPAATVADNKLHFVVRGSDGSTLWHRYYNFSTATYSDWTKLSGSTPSPPTLTG
jgi:hypothetical protein